MLGWDVFAYREGTSDEKTLVAHWSNGSDVVDWLEKLAKVGLAQDCGGTGYPWIFRIDGAILKAALGLGKFSEMQLAVLAKDVVPPLGMRNHGVLNTSVLRSLGGKEKVLVYAWDKS